MENNRLFVGNLSWDSTEESLTAAFGEYGTVVEAKIVTDRDTGRSKGFAFVTMGTPEEAKKARTELNGQTIEGRAIRIDEAQSKPRTGGGGGEGRGGDRTRSYNR